MRTALALFGLALVGGCAELAVVSDGTSVSFGRANDGALLNGRKLPLEGDGFVVLPTWSARGSQWGTDEMIDVIAFVGRSVAERYPGTRVAIGDLSVPGGGASAHHRSHQSGRDADFLLFPDAMDGKPLPATEMRPFGADGVTTGKGEKHRFDPARQWAVVRALIEAPGPGIANIFIYAPLRQELLDYARDAGEPGWLLDEVAAVMSQPGDSAPHDDHMHVRIYCSADDPGCVDYAPRPAPKKPRWVAVSEARELGGELRAHPIVGTLLHVGAWRW